MVEGPYLYSNEPGLDCHILQRNKELLAAGINGR